MIKLMLLLMLNIFPLSILPLDTNQDIQDLSNSVDKEMSFLEEVDKGYQYYEQYDQLSNDEFSVLIVKGIYNDKASYGVIFTSNVEKKYYALIEINDVTYRLEQDERGDSKAIAIESTYSMNLLIYDKKDKLQDIEFMLERFRGESYDTTLSTKGQGEGTEFSTLTQYIPKFEFFDIFVYLLIGVIITTSLLTLILFIKKKGMFNKEKRKEGILSIKDILSKETDDLIEVDYLENINSTISNSDLDNKEKLSEDIATDISNEPTKQLIKDIKAYLRDKGYITEYNALSEDEKNKIMLELMSLKDKGLIDLNDYYEESAELWKK